MAARRAAARPAQALAALWIIAGFSLALGLILAVAGGGVLAAGLIVVGVGGALGGLAVSAARRR
ncbi:hypothetical protein GCG21_14360 [Pseudactinotalea sp. HY160]|uniref:hypothetical protein n=1 Tax=Pseudactinotalea sp. HY160 TaxID=2654490 RepID=UPI00128C558B|nr:hypothetical protein [Pseudactinotalea sp. HY160]MPV51165.1 hypothetical protein [Pseudactinotalea sp. HY160]